MLDIPELDKRGLRQFGLVTGGIVAALFGLLLPWVFSLSYPVWPWIVAGVLAVWAIVLPQSLRLVYRNWMRFGLLMSKITTPVILGSVFFLLVLPMGLVMRLFGHDPLRRKWNSDSPSYRVPSSQNEKRRMEKPF